MLEQISWSMKIGRAISVLEEDRRLLLKGKTQQIAEQDARRQQIEHDLARIPEEIAKRYREELERIKSMAKRNRRLLGAYMDGAKKAVDTLTEIDRRQRDIGAYGRDGSKVPLSGGSTRFRRA